VPNASSTAKLGDCDQVLAQLLRKEEAEDAYQVAAPTESRTPHWHRAKNAHKRVRMEGWRQRRLGL